MKQLIAILALLSVAMCGQHLRNNNLNQHQIEKSFLQTEDIEYINDDATLDASVQEQAEEPQQQAEAQAEQEQSEENIIVTEDQQDQLDKEEQLEYEKQQEEALRLEKVSDGDDYLQDNEGQQTLIAEQFNEEDQMPVDVVENVINPTLPAEFDEKTYSEYEADVGGVSDFMLENQEEQDFPVEDSNEMPGEISMEEANKQYEEEVRKEQEDAERYFEQGPQGSSD